MRKVVHIRSKKVLVCKIFSNKRLQSIGEKNFFARIIITSICSTVSGDQRPIITKQLYLAFHKIVGQNDFSMAKKSHEISGRKSDLAS